MQKFHENKSSSIPSCHGCGLELEVSSAISIWGLNKIKTATKIFKKLKKLKIKTTRIPKSNKTL